MIKTLLFLLALLAPLPASAQWYIQPEFVEWFPDDTHWKTQVSHGLVTAAVAGGAAIPWGKRGAKIGSAAATAYYVIREINAHQQDRAAYAAGELTREEYDKASWDSKMDMVWPAYVTAVVWTWNPPRDWPMWIGGAWTIAIITRETDPGGMVFGMH